MGYVYQLNRYYKVKRSGKYPWPCMVDKNRLISLSTKDVLTRSRGNSYTKHTGLCCFGIKLKNSQVTLVKKARYLQVI